MDKDDIEYLISELIMDTRSITILENDIDDENINGSYVESVNEQLQLLYINRELAIDKLMEFGECKCH